MRILRNRQTASTLRMPPSLRFRRGVGKAGKRQQKLSISAMAKPLGMRAWLEDLLDNNTCKGLAWKNKQEKLFEMTWCHASRHDFDTKEHADLFIRYAEMTGRKGIAENGYNSKLKSNFRSALHSLNDCIQINGGSGKSSGENAVKTYQFIDSNHDEYKRKKLQKNKNQRSSKKGSTRSKSKINVDSIELKSEPQVSDNAISACDISNTQSHHSANEIILPDEAEEYLASTSTPYPQTTTCNIPDIPEISSHFSASPPLPQTSAESIFGTGLPITSLKSSTETSPKQSTSSSSSLLSSPPLVHYSLDASNNMNMIIKSDVNNESGVTNNEIIIGVSECESCSHQPSSKLPDFNSLGVDIKNIFEEPIKFSSTTLTSGGKVLIRKKEETAAHIPSVLIVKGIPQYQENHTFQLDDHTGQVLTVLNNDPLMINNTPESASDVELSQNIDDDRFQTGIEFPQSIVFISDLIHHGPAVTVMKNPENNSQGENYDLNVGLFTTDSL